MIEITDENFDTIINDDSGLVLIDFWASWCMPCKMMEPTLIKLEQIIKVGKVDVDSEIKLSARFSVKGIPTLIIFNNREIVQRYVGIQQYNTIKEAINSINIDKSGKNG